MYILMMSAAGGAARDTAQRRVPYSRGCAACYGKRARNNKPDLNLTRFASNRCQRRFTLLVWWEGRRKSDAHEETREGLGEMLKVWRLQSPARAKSCGMQDDVCDRQTDDLPKVEDERLAIVPRICRRGEQVQTFPATLSDFLPFALFGEIWIDLLELWNRGYRAKGHESDFLILKVATLRQDNEIGLGDFDFGRIGARAKIRREVRHETSGQQITLG
ncbi:MAG: hypothetical protein HY040_13305 [Planctomycetes bacterium]|nr:hypothetical protein [Planctomycetota bacterium]